VAAETHDSNIVIAYDPEYIFLQIQKYIIKQCKKYVTLNDAYLQTSLRNL